MLNVQYVDNGCVYFVFRLLEVRLDDQGTHVTPDDLIETLKNMNVTNVHDMEYMALYTGSKALEALTRLTSMDLDRLHYKPKELNKKIKKILRQEPTYNILKQPKGRQPQYLQGLRPFFLSKTGLYTMQSGKARASIENLETIVLGEPSKVYACYEKVKVVFREAFAPFLLPHS